MFLPIQRMLAAPPYRNYSQSSDLPDAPKSKTITTM